MSSCTCGIYHSRNMFRQMVPVTVDSRKKSGFFLDIAEKILTLGRPFHVLMNHEKFLRPGRHFTVLKNGALPSGQNGQLAPI
jgi:hypothetical protein